MKQSQTKSIEPSLRDSVKLYVTHSISGVQITPGEVIFKNIKNGDIQIQKICFQNVSSEKAQIIIYAPNMDCLYLTDRRDRQRCVLFPGMIISKYLAYITQRNYIRSYLKLIINDKHFDLYIEAKNCLADITITPAFLDFGVLNIGGKFAIRTMTLINYGNSSTKFAIVVGSNPIQVEPKRGTLKQSEKVVVQVRAAGVNVGQHTSRICIDFSNTASKFVDISITSISPVMMIHHPVKKGNVTILNFGSVFYGTCSYESFIVRNYSAENTIFILTVERNKKRKVYMEVDDEKLKKWLHVWPYHGTLAPFESMVISICFRPSKLKLTNGWQHKNPNSDDYMWANLKVEEVAQKPFKTDSLSEDHGKLKSLKVFNGSRPDEPDTSICVHGKAEQADLLFEPSCISMRAAVGQQDRSTISLTNPSVRLAVYFEFLKIPYVTTKPISGVIGPSCTIEVLITFSAKSFGSLNYKLGINIKSFCNLTDKEEIITLKKKFIPLELYTICINKQPKPAFNQGITPFIAQEVGVHTDNIKFSTNLSLVPRAAIVSLDKDLTSRPWFKNDSFTIAFPNDMALKLNKKPYDESKRSIFTGCPRYFPLANPNEALNSNEIKMMNKRKEVTREFIRSFALGKLGDNLHDYLSKSLSMERLHGLLQVSKTNLPAIRAPTVKPDRTMEKVVSLTPLELFNICITPENINFGLIPVGVPCNMSLMFENLNSFPIHFNFTFDNKLKFPKKITIGPLSKEIFELRINLNFTGKFISFFYYTICDIHQYHKTVRAEAVYSFLKIKPSVLEFPLPKNNDIYQPCYASVVVSNPFNSPTKFQWQLNEMHIIEVIPESGIIKENSSITCLIYIHKFFKVKKKVQIKLISNSVIVTSLACFIPAFTNYQVAPITDMINIKTIIAGTKITKSFFLFNNGCYKAFFSVRSVAQIDGVELFPKCGIIQPKSIEKLEMKLHFDCLMAIKFDILIDIEGILTKKIQVRGNVTFPTVELQPNKLSFLTTKCFSFSTQSVQMTNRATEDVTVTFSMQKYVQFKITTTPIHFDPGIDKKGIVLKPNVTTTVYVHFKPEHIASYEFYLPININNILGPPEKINSDRSSLYMNVPKPDGDRKRLKSLRLLSSHVNVVLKPPDTFDTVWISCVVQPPDIIISALEIYMESTMPDNPVNKKITISNPNDSPVTIQIGEVKYPFKLELPDGKESHFVIEGKEKCTIVITFKTFNTGSWSCQVPIYILNGTSTTYYNDLLLSAMCHPSSLYCSNSELYFTPVPLGTRISKQISIIAYHQRCDTDLKLMIFSKNNIERKIGVDYPESPHIRKNTKGVIVPLVISFMSAEVISLEAKLIFRDGMDGDLEITMFATSTDSLIPNHWYYFSSGKSLMEDAENDTHSKIALARSNSVVSRDSGLIRRTVGWRDSEITEIGFIKHRFSSLMLALPCNTNTESSTHTFEDEDEQYYWSKTYGYVMKWLLYCVFNGSFQPNLEDITWSKDFIEQSQLKKNTQGIKTFMDLIVALFGSEILIKTNLSCEFPGLDNVARIIYCLKAYSKILQHLDVYGVGLTHISPLYLLNYQDYLTLYEWKQNRTSLAPFLDVQSSIKSKKEFESFSKNMWLEFYLQLFKSHTLDMCVGLAIVDDWPKYGSLHSGFSTSSEDHIMEFDKMSPISKIITGDMLDQISQDRNHSEAVLMAWLSRIYYKVKERGPLDIPALGDNMIQDLGPCLRNGVVLAAVTAYYCPFLAGILSNIKIEPTTVEEILHNANYLILAWDEVKLGMMVKSEDILECNPIFMMMMLAYLYLSLPTFLPTYILRAAAPLADTGSTTLTLTNQSNFPLRYYVKIYQDSFEPFSIIDRKLMYNVKARGHVDITINFVSNRIGKVSGLLVLCGANGPKVHGINMSVKLEGEPTSIKISNKIVVKLPVYQQVFIHQKIVSPYDKDAEYTLATTISKPSLDFNYLQEWKSKTTCMVPRSVIPGCGKIIVPAYPQPAVLQISCCSYISETTVRWITFSSPTAGDFVCKVILLTYDEINPPSYTIEFPLDNEDEMSKEESFIPIDLKLPSSNLSMSRSSLSMLCLMIKFDELYFYRNYWNSYIGMKLFEQELLTLCPSLIPKMHFLFHIKVAYDITFDSPLVKAQDQIIINDIYSEDSLTLPIKLMTRVTKPFCTVMKLTRKSGSEVRSFKLNFIPNCKNH